VRIAAGPAWPRGNRCTADPRVGRGTGPRASDQKDTEVMSQKC
jgi:hypothetical protein